MKSHVNGPKKMNRRCAFPGGWSMSPWSQAISPRLPGGESDCPCACLSAERPTAAAGVREEIPIIPQKVSPFEDVPRQAGLLPSTYRGIFLCFLKSPSIFLLERKRKAMKLRN